MCRVLRGQLAAAIAESVASDRRLQAAWRDRGRFEFFGDSANVDRATIEDLIAFLDFFCFEADGSLNGFSEPWRIVHAICATKKGVIVYTSPKGAFLAEAKQLKDARARRDDWLDAVRAHVGVR